MLISMAMAGVARARALRNQHLNGLTQKLFPAIAKRAFRGLVHQDDPALAVHLQNGIGSRIQKLTKALLQPGFLGKI